MSSWNFGYNTVNAYNPYCTLTVTENSTSTTNNTSSITATLVLHRPSSVSSSASKSWSMSIAGTSYSGTTTIGGSGDKTIATKTLTVSHDSDGSKTITCSASFTLAVTWSGTYIGTISLSSKSMTLTTIARKSSITSASSVTTGNACSIKWTPASSSFKFKIKFTVGSKSYTTGTISPSTTSAYTYTGYTMSTSTWAPYITSATSATCTATLYTYSGSTSIGSSSKTFTLTVASSVKPSLSLSISDANGYATTYGYLVGKSKISYTVTQSASLYGATVTYKTTVNGSTYTASNTSASAGTSGTSGTLSTSGTNTISVTATDSRGRTASKSSTFTVYAYSAPVINTFSVARQSSDSTKVTATLTKASYYKANGSNTITAKIYYAKNGGSYNSGSTVSLTKTTSTTPCTATGSYSSWSSGTFSTSSSYNIKLIVTDSVGSTATKILSISTEEVLMDFREGGGGLGIGKIAEGDYLDVGMEAVFNDDVDITGDLKVNDGYVLYGAYATTTSEYVALNIYITNGTSYGWIPVLVVSNKWVGYVTLSGTSATSSFTSINTYSTIYGTEPSSIDMITDSSVSGGVRLKLLWSSSSTSGMANVFGIRNMACPVTKIAFASS